jgi:L-ascorbate metabolism protein UlaG (beta-lactamase superfamily)
LADAQNIDAVVVSHKHYDHMDEASLRQLATQGAQIFVPLGNRTQVLK